MLPILLLLALWPAAAQELLVYPELQRPSPKGDVLAADRSGREWEIISPAAPRNGYLSFFVVVRLPGPGFFRLDIAMNPAGRLRADLYRVHFSQPGAGDEYYPEGLDLAGQTVIGTLPDPHVPSPRVAVHSGPAPGQDRGNALGHNQNFLQNQTAPVAAYWLDLYVPGDAPAERVRVEAVLQSAGPRIVYPMEVRVLPIAFPAWNVASPLRGSAAALAPIFEPAQATMLGLLDGWMRGEPLRPPNASAGAGTIRQKIERNAWQDLALLDSLDSRQGRQKLKEEVQALLGGAKQPPDWWLDFRRWLYRVARE